ncbi:MAG: hypothetical protein ACM31G_04910, partial [Flavobacteriales bacterium]
AQGNINSLNLPANSTIALPELKFDVKTAIVAQEALNDFDMNTLKYKIDVEAFGNIITLDYPV